MDKHQQLADYLQGNPGKVSKVVDINADQDHLLQLDFTQNNQELTADDIANTAKFSRWVEEKLSRRNCRYGIGGYMEHRTLYARSALFNTSADEPRRLHLGVDIWGPAGTKVYAPLQGKVHSFQNNNNYGDYGPTIILEHNLDGLTLYSLYGHLNSGCLDALYLGKEIKQGQEIALFGAPTENGNWPPHLHFQLMFDMQGMTGDYPGVCRFSQMEEYRLNVPNPEILLQLSEATII
jgi:murein DD-endopeptidase MepM/ murein hydrolase activator NlpD